MRTRWLRSPCSMRLAMRVSSRTGLRIWLLSARASSQASTATIQSEWAIALKKFCESVVEVVLEEGEGEVRRGEATLVEISMTGSEEAEKSVGVTCVMLVPVVYGAFDVFLTGFGVNSFESKTTRLLESNKIIRTWFPAATCVI